MNSFVMAYAVVWLALTLYVVRQVCIHRRLVRAMQHLRQDVNHSSR